MGKDTGRVRTVAELKRMAESSLEGERAGELAGASRPRDRARLIHDLTVYEVALEQAVSELARAHADLRRAKAELRETQSRFRLISDHVDDVFVLHERAPGRFTYVSTAFESVWGRPPAAAHGAASRWARWIHQGDRRRVGAAYRNMLKGDPFDEELRILRPDGETRWIRARAFPVEEQDGQVSRDVGVIQDITNERELEEELRQAQKMEAVGALASGVAHDFNNVLQAILGCLNVARADDTAPELAREFLDRAASAARRGGDLADQLMTFSRKQKAEPHAIEIDAAIRDVAKLIKRLVTEQVDLEIRTGAPSAAIVADAVQIEQILMNLASNARDAMPEGGALHISTSLVDPGMEPCRGLAQSDFYVRLQVRDTGVGMERGVRERIFEPFFTTKEIGHGTGLGLSTVFAVTKQLGGCIDVDSEVGRGTVFNFYFPTVELPVRPAGSEVQAMPKLGGTALLVEDEPLVRVTVRHYLEELGLEVLEAEDAAEARLLCEHHARPVDVLVSDIILPVTRGPKLAAELRERHPELRVLFMSTSPEVHEGRPPHSAILQKPFGQEELAAELQRLFADEPSPSKAEGAPRSAERTILLVEDEPATRLALGDLLRRRGYRVHEAGKPTRALQIAAEVLGGIDMLITDVLLPEMSGEELARRLRRAHPSLRAVFMSGLPNRPLGASAFVRKPIDLAALLDVVEGTLAQARE